MRRLGRVPTFAERRRQLLATPSSCMLAAATAEATLRAELALRGYPPHVADKTLELAKDLARYSNLSALEAINRVRRIAA